MPIVIQGEVSSGGGSGAVLSHTATITAAQLKALTTVAQELVPAISGALIVPLSITLELLYATTPYDNPPSSDVELVTGSDPFGIAAGWLALSPASVTDVVTVTASVVSSWPILPANVTAGSPALDHPASALVFGMPLWIVNYGTELATGDSPIKVTTLYGTVAT